MPSIGCFAAMRSPVRGAFTALSRDGPQPGLLMYAPDAGASGAGSPRQATPFRVLVVEDNLDVAETLGQSLTAWGYVAQICTTGHEALALAPYFQPAVVIIDIGLPDLDGWQLARKLRRVPFDREPVMIVVTAFGEKADFERSQQAGISFHLVKPAYQTQLRQLLHRLAHET